MTLVLAPSALAGGGNYVFEGGTGAQQAQVVSALEASTFPWGIVTQQITISIAPGVGSWAIPGTIALDADLLDAGMFSWGTIQHEYAHEVDFFVLDDLDRNVLLQRLGGVGWYGDAAAEGHSSLASERFASTLAWAFWASPKNTMRPVSKTDEAGFIAPKAFRTLLGSLLGQPKLAAVRR